MWLWPAGFSPEFRARFLCSGPRILGQIWKLVLRQSFGELRCTVVLRLWIKTGWLSGIKLWESLWGLWVVRWYLNIRSGSLNAVYFESLRDLALYLVHTWNNLALKRFVGRWLCPSCRLQLPRGFHSGKRCWCQPRWNRAAGVLGLSTLKGGQEWHKKPHAHWIKNAGRRCFLVALLALPFNPARLICNPN